MTSELKAAQNKINATRSTGPRTSRGKMRSSMNARKHGRRSEREKVLRGDSYNSEVRRMKWMLGCDPKSDMEEFVVAENVNFSFELERARGAHLDGITTRIKNADWIEYEEVHELGRRLFFDRCSPAQIHGKEPDLCGQIRTSSNGKAVDPDDPAVLVRKLESTATGVCWMIDQWDELLQTLKVGSGLWLAVDRFKAVRLLGRQPIEAGDNRQVAQIYLASYALNVVVDQKATAWDDLKTDMSTPTHTLFVNEVRRRWKYLLDVGKTDEAKQLLIDLVEGQIKELEELLEGHDAADPSEHAASTVARMGFDPTPEGKDRRNHYFKCYNAMLRGVQKQSSAGRRRVSGQSSGSVSSPLLVVSGQGGGGRGGKRRGGALAGWGLEGEERGGVAAG